MKPVPTLDWDALPPPAPEEWSILPPPSHLLSPSLSGQAVVPGHNCTATTGHANTGMLLGPARLTESCVVQMLMGRWGGVSSSAPDDTHTPPQVFPPGATRDAAASGHGRLMHPDVQQQQQPWGGAPSRSGVIWGTGSKPPPACPPLPPQLPPPRPAPGVISWQRNLPPPPRKTSENLPTAQNSGGGGGNVIFIGCPLSRICSQDLFAGSVRQLPRVCLCLFGKACWKWLSWNEIIFQGGGRH